MQIISVLDSYTLLWLEWSIGSVLVGLSGLLVLNYSELLPNFIHRLVKYGKSAGSGKGGHQNEQQAFKLNFLELPKSYFFHFYSVALLFYIFLLTLATNIYFNLNLFGADGHNQFKQSSVHLRSILDYFASYDTFTSYRYMVNFDRSIISYQRAASGKF